MAYSYDLIGRQQELDDLSRRLTSVRESKGGLVLLAGEAGVGKTRLAEESLAESGLLSLQGRGNEEATRLSGINVNRVKLWVYIINAGLAALVGVLVGSGCAVSEIRPERMGLEDVFLELVAREEQA